MAFFRLVKKTFCLDHRSLACYRFFIGLIIVADSIYRLMDVTNFYTDVGLVPRSLFLNEMTMPWSFSFFLANGSKTFAVSMFLINILIGLCVMFGYKTRWALVLAYVMNVSIHNRNWLINNGGDDILRAILFLSIFLPLNKYFSIDAALTRNKEKEDDDHHSIWGLTFFLQVFLIYFIGWALKDHPIWRVDFTAVFYSSRLDIFATPFGVWLRNFPLIQKGITLWSILLEWGGPLLLIFAFAFGRFWWVTRVLVVAAFISFHFGIILTMWIGVFPYTCMAMWTIFLPGPFWDRIFGYFRSRGMGAVTLYFDRNCRFCEKAALIFKEFFLLPQTRVLSAQENPAVQKLMEENHSWVIEDPRSERHFHYAGLLCILRHSPWAFPLAHPLSAKFFSVPANRLYVWVSNHRPLLSKFSQFLEFREARKRVDVVYWPVQLFGAVIFVTILMWNLTTVKKLNVKAPLSQKIARTLHLYQEWNMFAPYPKLDNIWVEAPGVLTDGSEIDLITGDRDVYSIKDKAFVQSIKNEHWRKFYLNVSEKLENSRYYGGYFCRLWNDRKEGLVKGVGLRKMEIIVFSQLNLPTGEKGGIVRKTSWKHWCFDEDYKKESKEASKKSE